MPYSYQVETSLLFFVIDLDHDPTSSNFELDLYHMSHTCTKLFKSVKPFIRCRPSTMQTDRPADQPTSVLLYPFKLCSCGVYKSFNFQKLHPPIFSRSQQTWIHITTNIIKSYNDRWCWVLFHRPLCTQATR